MKDGKDVCRGKTKEEKCRDRGGIWSGEKCACPPEHKNQTDDVFQKQKKINVRS